MAPEHDVGPRLKVQASRGYEVSRGRLCLDSPASQVGRDLPRIDHGLFNQPWSPNAKWEQGRERPGKEGRLKGIGKLTPPRNPDGPDPRSRARTAVVGTFTNSVTGKLQLLHVRDVWRSVEREHARRRHLVDRWNVLVGAGVTSIANRAFSVGPVTFTLAAGFLSLVKQGEELLDLHQPLLVHSAFHGSFRSIRSHTDDGTPYIESPQLSISAASISISA
ncbi:hypothetical protein HRG_005357 [Hirsutella rhossiliensis]|uniref:Uncharacterized protein n=1 Tax=Hirsutella rhossiliensis TaxID=111463 RepID=A0A9P8N162_9HYPO|nr:uncharacterized protein HRG_05357 [Hirsutella rhossiliensis]KAH0962847.1 hypothetical protein HRG_05357 [Hirsutella rhossiliensis]